MPSKIYGFTALTGGGAGALDGIDGAALAEDDIAVGVVSGVAYEYQLNATLGGSESSPRIIMPDAHADNKRWVLSTDIRDYEIDALDYSPHTYTQATIEAALAAIGTTNKVTLLLRPGTWVISSNADWSAYTNMTFKIVPGALLQIATGTTTTIPHLDESGMHQRFSCDGTGKVSFPAGSVKEVDPNWWTQNLVPKTTDMTTAVQAAIIAGIPGNIPINVPSMMLLTAHVHIDREVDNILYHEYFTIKSSDGGGFYVNTAIPMFSSTYAYADDPISQLIKFDGIHFESGTTNMAAYVLDKNMFLRVLFQGCTFEQIKCLVTVTPQYIQSIYFLHCNIRRWTGWFIYEENWTFDVKFSGNMIEHSYGPGGGLIYMKSPTGVAITDNLIEGMGWIGGTGTGIAAYATKSLLISGNYFEGNAIDIDLTSGVPNQGVIIVGNNIANIVNSQGSYVGMGNANGTINLPNLLNYFSDAAMRESIGPTGGIYTTGLTADSSFDIETGSVYLVTLAVQNGINILESIGQWVVARQGTGTKVVQILAPLYFTCTMSTYKIRITNTDGTTKNASTTVLRIQ